MELTRSSVAKLIDHTLLKPEASSDDVRTFCDEAIALRPASVCVTSAMVSVAATRLARRVPVCTVIGFPSGAHPTIVKCREITQAFDDGAVEFDVVANLAMVVDGNFAAMMRELVACRDAIGSGHVMKVILETAALTEAEQLAAGRVAHQAGADFLKTSTGFHPSGGATVDAVKLLRSIVGPHGHVKASGGIRTLAAVESMVAAGADRIGMSSTAAVLGELNA